MDSKDDCFDYNHVTHRVSIRLYKYRATTTDTAGVKTIQIQGVHHRPSVMTRLLCKDSRGREPHASVIFVDTDWKPVCKYRRKTPTGFWRHSNTQTLVLACSRDTCSTHCESVTGLENQMFWAAVEDTSFQDLLTSAWLKAKCIYTSSVWTGIVRAIQWDDIMFLTVGCTI